MQCTYQVNFSREDGTEDLCLYGTLMRLCYPISSGISPLCHIPVTVVSAFHALDGLL